MSSAGTAELSPGRSSISAFLSGIDSGRRCFLFLNSPQNVILSGCDFLDLSCSRLYNQLSCKLPNKTVILRACDFFDGYPTSCISPPHKAVILSEARRGVYRNRELYSAESKDPGDGCWQMLLRAFRKKTTTEDKKVTNSERSRGTCSAPFVCPAATGPPQPPPSSVFGRPSYICNN